MPSSPSADPLCLSKPPHTSWRTGAQERSELLGRGSRSKAGFTSALLAFLRCCWPLVDTTPCLSCPAWGAASLGKDCGCACRARASLPPGMAGSLWGRTCPSPHPPPAHQGHHEGDTATTGDTFHHQDMLVSQHLSSGKEKRQ